LPASGEQLGATQPEGVHPRDRFCETALELCARLPDADVPSFAEGQLDGVEVGRIGWKIKERCTRGFDRLLDADKGCSLIDCTQLRTTP